MLFPSPRKLPDPTRPTMNQLMMMISSTEENAHEDLMDILDRAIEIAEMAVETDQEGNRTSNADTLFGDMQMDPGAHQEQGRKQHTQAHQHHQLQDDGQNPNSKEGDLKGGAE